MIDGLPERIHCLGASGAGMLPLALLLKAEGHRVSAEDAAFSVSARKWLEAAGVEFAEAHDLDDENTLVVHSSALGSEHPSMLEAKKRGWQTLRRGACLALWAEGRRLIAVAGSHGKTTTCGMLVDLLEACGRPTSYALGALFDGEKPPAALADEEWAVAEIDESDGTIENFAPEISITLNADHDHHSQYASSEEYLAAFGRLIERTRLVAFVAADLKAALASYAERSSAEVVWVGAGGDATWGSKPSGPGMTAIEAQFGSVSISLETNRIGAFNASNAIFAYLATTRALNLELLPIDSAAFTSVKRRQTGRYLSPDCRVVEDYAHHPVEIASLLDSVKQRLPQSRAVVVFQPHRYSRTLELKEELADSLKGSDRLYLLDVYAASEIRQEGGESEDLLETCLGAGIDCRLAKEEEALFSQLLAEMEGSDTTFVFLGAGRTDTLAQSMADRLSAANVRWGKVFSAIGSVASWDATLRGQEPMAKKTTLRVGGSAELYFEPDSIRSLQAIAQSCRASDLPFRVLGRGSNLIVPDAGVPGVVARLNHPCWRRWRKVGDDGIWVGAGMRIKELCGLAGRLGLAGFEFLEGIPGSVGGALRMNAGAMGGWIFDVCQRIRYLNAEGELIEARSEELDTGYRHCGELREGIAVEALLVATETGQPSQEIRSAIDVYQNKRKESQPREPSAGCIFKNPQGDAAGRIIDELGLKGAAIGGAEISLVHGNFIVNTGGARSSDVIELIKLVRREAWAKKRIELQPEALLYGDEWDAVLK